MRKTSILLFVSLFFFCGCAKLAHLQELLTLKAYSEEKDRQAEYVEAQDRKFELLLADTQGSRLAQGTTQQQVLKSYGDPILRRSAERDGQVRELWLYRYAVRYFDSDKVYLYFDQDGGLQDWEVVIFTPAESDEEQKTRGL